MLTLGAAGFDFATWLAPGLMSLWRSVAYPKVTGEKIDALLHVHERKRIVLSPLVPTKHIPAAGGFRRAGPRASICRNGNLQLAATTMAEMDLLPLWSARFYACSFSIRPALCGL
jgi:hypothetical protein